VALILSFSAAFKNSFRATYWNPIETAVKPTDVSAIEKAICSAIAYTISSTFKATYEAAAQ
jgi:hypothetical protein